MRSLAGFALTIAIVLPAADGSAVADDTPSLMTMVARWQYPDATFHGAEMSDGETVNSDGERTRPSIRYQTVLTTPDAVDKVVAFYKAKLRPTAEENVVTKAADKAAGQSVTFLGDSEGRPLSVQVIVVNTDTATTTLVISRGENEAETHIAWTHYVRL